MSKKISAFVFIHDFRNLVSDNASSFAANFVQEEMTFVDWVRRFVEWAELSSEEDYANAYEDTDDE